MIWVAITRLGAIISTYMLIRELRDLAGREVKPNRIYSTTDVGRFLGIERTDVVRLIQRKELKGRLVARQYRISGHSLMEYLRDEG